jgi:hypothetical protein
MIIIIRMIRALELDSNDSLSEEEFQLIEDLRILEANRIVRSQTVSDATSN